jgi:hypothetical protein|tara:strand:- start:628 stop:807 length:180 start_codon:yes stop_codon:yes gene_type:complete
MIIHYDLNRIVQRLAKDEDQSVEVIANFVKEKIEEYYTIDFHIEAYKTVIKGQSNDNNN